MNEVELAEFLAQVPKDSPIDRFAAACAWVRIQDVGIKPPSPAALLEVLAKNGELVETLNQWYAEKPDSDWSWLSLDTQDCDTVMDVVAQHFVGHRWPMFKDGEEANAKFRVHLSEAMRHEGWQFQPGT